MSQTNIEIPQGYKQTKVGIIPEDWEVKKLSSVVNVLSGNAFKSKHRTEYGIKWLKIANVGLEEIKYDVIEYLPEQFSEKYKQYLLQKGDFVMALTRPLLNGKLKISQIKNDEFWLLNQRVAKLYTTNNNILFITKLLKLPIYSYYIDVLMAGTDPPNLSITDFKKIKLPIPPLPEQEKIADCLTTWDKAITQTKKLIEAKKQVKKGLMQQLLTGKKRLPGFTEKWKEVKLGEVFKLKKGKDLSKSSISERGKNKCILYGELYTKYSEIINNVVSKTDATESFPSKKGDILIPSSTTTNGWDLITSSCVDEDNVLLGGDIIVLRPKNNKINSYYFSYLFSNALQKEVIGFTQGVTIIHLYGSDLIKLKIKLPNKNEQTAIAKILQTADKEIDLLEEKLKTLEQQKKGLMQVLLTGKKRLV